MSFSTHSGLTASSFELIPLSTRHKDRKINLLDGIPFAKILDWNKYLHNIHMRMCVCLSVLLCMCVHACVFVCMYRCPHVWVCA